MVLFVHLQTIKTERKNEKKVIELTLERDQLRTEIESLKTRLHESETLLSSERKEYLKKAGLLQDQLHDEQKSSKETISKIKEVRCGWRLEFLCLLHVLTMYLVCYGVSKVGRPEAVQYQHIYFEAGV